MNRALPVVFVLLLGAVAAFLFTGNDEPAPSGPGDAPSIENGSNEQEAGDPDVRVRDGDLEKREAVQPTNATVGDDAFYQASLSGFRGRVVTSAGEPVPESAVRLFRIALDGAFAARLGVFADGAHVPDFDAGSARTDAAGKFLIADVEPHAMWLLQADVGGDAPTTRMLQATPKPGEVIDIGDVVLADCGVLVGTVVDPDGEPIANALVRAVDLPGAALSGMPFERLDPEGGVIVKAGGFGPDTDMVMVFPSWAKERFEQLPIPATRTNADGTFRLTGVAPGSNLVAINSPGLLPNVRPRVLVKAGEERDLGRLRMAEGEAVWGKVVDMNDQPIADAEVVIAAETPVAPVHFASYAKSTDKEGLFELAGFPARRAVVAARRPGMPWVVGEMQAAGKEHVVRLPSSHQLTLSVTGPDGRPRPNARIQIVAGDDDQGAVEQALWGVNPPLDLDGRVEIDDEERIVIRDLPEARYAVVVGHDACASAVLGVQLDQNTELAVQLGPSQAFHVTVLGPEGEPVKNAKVFAEPRGADSLPDEPVLAGRTDAEGRIEVDQLTGDSVRLTAAHPAWGQVHQQTETLAGGEFVLQFQLPGTIEGVLSENGSPPAPGKWMIWATPKWGGPRGAMPNMPQLTAPNLDGQFTFPSLQPGEYQVGVFDSIEGLTSAGGVMELAMAGFAGGNDRPEQTVQLAPGDVAHVELDAAAEQQIEGPAVNVSGTVLMNGRAAQGLMVRAWGNGVRRNAEVGPGGTFDLGAMPVGHCRMELMEKPDKNSMFGRGGFDELWSHNVELKEGEDHHVEISFDTASMSGVAIGVDGRPAANARVVASGMSVRSSGDGDESKKDYSHFRFDTTTDAKGRFSFDNKPTAAYTLSVRGKDAGRGTATVDLNDGVNRQNLRIQMSATFTASGTIDFTGLPADRRWVWVSFNPSGEGESSSDGVGEDGKFEIKGLVPGEYRVQVQVSTEDDWKQYEHPDTILIRGDAEGLVLRPQLKKRD